MLVSVSLFTFEKVIAWMLTGGGVEGWRSGCLSAVGVNVRVVQEGMFDFYLREVQSSDRARSLI